MHLTSAVFLVSQKFLFAAGELAQDKPVVVSKFILNAKEIEFDGVAQEGKILNYAISEHVEVRMDIQLICLRTFEWTERKRRLDGEDAANIGLR